MEKFLESYTISNESKIIEEVKRIKIKKENLKNLKKS